MGNSIITATGLTKEALRILHNNLVFLRGVDKQYSKEFAVSGAKIGSTINVRMPNRYYVSHQTALQAQSTSESTVPLQLTTPFQVGLVFTQQDLTLSMDEFSSRILKPAMSRLASDMDMYGLTMGLDLYNQVGTPGSVPGTNIGSGLRVANTPQIFLNAGAVLDSFACPRDDNRHCLLNPQAQAGAVGGLSGLWQDAGSIASQYKKGVMGHALGFDFAMDQNINTLVTGTRAFTFTNFVTASASQTGANLSVQVNSQSQNGLTFAKGERISIAGLYSVNPENQQSTGMLFTAVITATTTVTVGAGSAFTLPIYPAIKMAAAGVADATATGTMGSGAQINLLTTAGTTACTASENIVQNMAYHKEAFTFATADLEKPNGVDFAAREVYDGISMLVVRDYDINSAQFPCRVDVLAGWKTLRPEFGSIIAG